ncbi:MAG: YHS domain-containing protein [Methanothermobacter tenebrarum]
MKKGWFLVFSLVALFVVTVVAARLAEEVRDPVCGMKLNSSKAKFTAEYQGQKYYFCSADCQTKFKLNPEKYVSSQQGLTKETMVCCSLSKELLAEVKTERKERDDGFEVTMTSGNPAVVQKLQETLGKCHQEMMAGAQAEHGHEKSTQAKQTHEEHMAQHQHGTRESKTQAACCLMHDQGYDVKLVNLNNGVRLEFRKKS